MKGTVYRGTRLMPGSHALALLQAGDIKALNAHMARLHAEAVKRGELL